jgi:hypothetical protein
MKRRQQPEDRRGREAPHAPGYTLFDRSRHPPPRGVIATLDDLSGWTAEVETFSAVFGISPEAALWGEVGTFIEIAPVGPETPLAGSITLRPPRPLPILPDAACFEIWIRGDTFDSQQLKRHPELTLLARASGDTGEAEILLAPCINWPTFSLRMQRIPEALRGGKGTVTGLRIRCEAGERRRRIGLDRLCACRDERPPLSFSPRPRRPLTLPEGQNHGLNSGPGWLPFPTREETILPDNLANSFAIAIERQDNAVQFSYRGKEADIRYTWRPAADPLRVAIHVNGHALGEALAETAWGGERSVDWVAETWRGNRYADEDPLANDQLRRIPGETLHWRNGPVAHCAEADTSGDQIDFPPYDIGRHGGSPIYHLYREIEADNDMEIALSVSAPREHTALWLNGERIDATRKGGSPERTLGNGCWMLRLRQGRNLICIRLILWPGGSCAFKPLPGGTRWLDCWKVFGPSTYNPGAVPPQPIGVLPLNELSVTEQGATARFAHPHFGPLTIRLRMMGKSLAIDVRNPGGRLACFQPGAFAGLRHARLRKAPAMGDNAILVADTADGQPCFCSLYHDWYRSNASFWSNAPCTDGTRAALQGPILYRPTTDGIRNGCYERYFLTCSPIYEEVLPNIPNPASPWAREAGRYVFQESWGPACFARELAKARRWAAFGMTDILHLHHELGWSHEEPATPARDNQRYWVNDGCTLRLDVAPAKGGTEAMQRFLAAEQALGLRAGLYTNYTDYYTLNSRFRSDLPILLPDGSRQTAWVHSYAMKPALAVEFDAWFAPRIATRFRPTTAYTDVHTCVAPWQRVDYDARVPGAGTFAATYYAFGELLLNDQRHYAGPVFSEGGYHQWLYAGLASGNYGQIIITPDSPLDPAFNLLKIHPLETNIGLGVGTTGWIRREDSPEAIAAQVDRYLLACLIYGHIAYLPEEPFDPRLLLRVYHLARAATSHMAGARPEAIHYARAEGGWQNLSEVQAAGVDGQERLRIRYPGGKVLYANGSRTKAWRLTDDGTGPVILPPNGFRFTSPRGLICASDEIEGRRCDRAETPGGWFLDGRGAALAWGPITASGSVALITDPSQEIPWKLIDGGGNTTIRLAAMATPARLRARAEDGRILAVFEPACEGETRCMTPIDGAVRYEPA